MQRLMALVVGAAIVVGSAACSRPTGTLEAAEETLGEATVQSIEYSGTGKWFQFGQAPNPTLPWPPFDVSSFKAAVNYDDAGRASGNGPEADARAAARAACARRATPRAGRQRDVCLEPGGAGRGSRRHAASRAGAACRGCGTHDGNLGDAARVPQSGARQQCHLRGRKRRLHCFIYSRREGQVRRHDQRPESGGESADLDRQPGAGRYAGRDDLLRLQGLRRRDVPRAHRADAGRASGAGYQRLGGKAESAGRYSGTRERAQLHAPAGPGQRREACGRCLLHDGR